MDGCHINTRQEAHFRSGLQQHRPQWDNITILDHARNHMLVKEALHNVYAVYALMKTAEKQLKCQVFSNKAFGWNKEYFVNNIIYSFL